MNNEVREALSKLGDLGDYLLMLEDGDYIFSEHHLNLCPTPTELNHLEVDKDFRNMELSLEELKSKVFTEKNTKEQLKHHVEEHLDTMYGILY